MIRIGELSRRSGVSIDSLRAWERRYGLLEPVRSDGGFRLYSAADEARVARMQRLIAGGVAAAEAARLTLASTPAGDSAPNVNLPAAVEQLLGAIDSLDEATANAVLDQLLSTLSLDAVADRAILPALREIGDRWAAGRLSVAQEHFGSNLIRGRLTSLARGWGAGAGPVAVLACLPGERHDIGLVVFGLALRERGWRITYLGPDTPAESVGAAAREVGASVVVGVTFDASLLEASSEALRGLAARHPVLLAGAGVGSDVAASLGARHLAGGPVQAASRVDAALPL